MSDSSWLDEIRDIFQTPMKQDQQRLEEAQQSLVMGREKTTTWEADVDRMDEALPHAKRMNSSLKIDNFRVSLADFEDEMRTLLPYDNPRQDPRVVAYIEENNRLVRQILQTQARQFRQRVWRFIKQIGKAIRGRIVTVAGAGFGLLARSVRRMLRR